MTKDRCYHGSPFPKTMFASPFFNLRSLSFFFFFFFFFFSLCPTTKTGTRQTLQHTLATSAIAHILLLSFFLSSFLQYTAPGPVFFSSTRRRRMAGCTDPVERFMMRLTPAIGCPACWNAAVRNAASIHASTSPSHRLLGFAPAAPCAAAAMAARAAAGGAGGGGRRGGRAGRECGGSRRRERAAAGGRVRSSKQAARQRKNQGRPTFFGQPLLRRLDKNARARELLDGGLGAAGCQHFCPWQPVGWRRGGGRRGGSAGRPQPRQCAPGGAARTPCRCRGRGGAAGHWTAPRCGSHVRCWGMARLLSLFCLVHHHHDHYHLLLLRFLVVRFASTHVVLLGSLS